MSDATPAASVIRRELREMRQERRDRREVAVDWYTWVFAVGLFGAMAYAQFGASFDVRSCTVELCRQDASRHWLALAAGLALLAAGSRLVRLMGPLGATPAELTWTYATPVRRADLLRPRLSAAVVAAGLTGAAVGGLLLILPAHVSFGLASGVLGAAALTGAAVGGAGVLAQVHPAMATALGRLEVLVAVVAVVLTVAVILGWFSAVPVPAVLTRSGMPLSLLTCLTAVGWAARDLDSVPARELRRGGAAQRAVSSAGVMVDPTVVTTFAQGRRAESTGRFRSRPLLGSGLVSMAAVEARRLRRRPGLLWSVLGSAVLPIVVFAFAGRTPGAIVAVVVLLGSGRAMAAGIGAWGGSGGLRRLIPLPTPAVRVAMLLPAAGVLLIWSALVVGLAGLPVSFAAAFVLAGLSATLRGAEPPPPPDFSLLVATPAGALPLRFVFALADGLGEALVCVAAALLGPPVFVLAVGVSCLAVTSRRASWNRPPRAVRRPR